VGKINTTQQQNQSFREFLQEVDQTLVEANSWAWEEEIKKDLSNTALNSEVARELAGRDEPKTYTIYMAQSGRSDLKTRKMLGMRSLTSFTIRII
jgi:hypothetical protein